MDEINPQVLCFTDHMLDGKTDMLIHPFNF